MKDIEVLISWPVYLFPIFFVKDGVFRTSNCFCCFNFFVFLLLVLIN